MVGAGAGLQEHLKLAREYALEGLYDTSAIFFDGAIAQINKHLSTLDDPLVRNKWMKCKKDLSEEIEIIKQLDAERKALKELPGTIRPTSPGLPSKSYMFQPVDEYSSFSAGTLDDPDVWRPPTRDPQQQYGSRRPTRAGQMGAAQSRKDASWARSSSRPGDMKSIGGVGRGAKANAASTSGRAALGGRATGTSAQQGKKGASAGRSTPNKRDSLAEVELMKQKQLETQTELIRNRRECEEWQRKAAEAELNSSNAKQNLQRFEEKLCSLDHEKQVLRQQAIVISPNNGLMDVAKPVFVQKSPEFHQHSNGDQKHHFESPIPSQIFREFSHTPSESRHPRIMVERQQENQEVLLKCVRENLGFSGDKPIAACIIYKCLLMWHAFEAERTSIFEHLIRAILLEIEDQEDVNALSYWLSNISTLLFLLQRNLRSNGFPTTPHVRLKASISHLGRLTQGFRSPSNAASPGTLASFGDHTITQQVQAKYPALLFKQQLTAALERVYGLIRDDAKKELTPLLVLCIQASRVSRASVGRGSRSPNICGYSQQALRSHWDSIIKILNSLLDKLRANHVPAFFIRKLFAQVFSFINVQLFNSMLLRRECCSFSNGEYVKFGVGLLEQWIREASEEYAGTSWDELRYIRQAVSFLVIHQKQNKSLQELTNEICPVLSIQQIYRISTMYWDDKYGTQSLSSEVVKDMREVMKKGSHDMSNSSFLLDDDLSVPFSADDISNTINDIDLSDVEPPSVLREFAVSQLLLQHSR